MSRLLPLLLLPMLACEPADPVVPIDAEPSPDAGLDGPPPMPMDAMAGCPDDDGDGVRRADCAEPGQPQDCDDTDPRVRPAASDPCGDGIDQDCDGADTRCPEGCVPNADLAPCDAVDDDCDGVIDECEDRQVCEADRCVGRVGAECGEALPCARGADCIDGQCTTIEPGGLCGDDMDCPADAICRVDPVCDPADDRCYALQGGRCATTCDCSGTFLCDDDSNRCVDCLLDAQCDAPTRCTGAGLCATPTLFGGPAVDAWDQLLAEIVGCWTAHDGAVDAQGCSRLDAGELVVDGETVGALTPEAPGPTCERVMLEARGFTLDDIQIIESIFGCEGEPALVWSAPIPAERMAAACISYLPPWARADMRQPGISIAPCNVIPYGRPAP